MRIYFELFWSFFKIGAFTIGGGYAMIPLIEDEIVNKKKWLTAAEFLDIISLAQSAPGVIAINTSIFIGYRLRKFAGSIIATLGCALPSFIIILIIAITYRDFTSNVYIEKIFRAIRPAVVALIVSPLIGMSKTAKINYKTVIIPLSVAFLVWKFQISPIIFVILGIIIGVVYAVIIKKKINTNRN